MQSNRKYKYNKEKLEEKLLPKLFRIWKKSGWGVQAFPKALDFIAVYISINKII